MKLIPSSSRQCASQTFSYRYKEFQTNSKEFTTTFCKCVVQGALIKIGYVRRPKSSKVYIAPNSAKLVGALEHRLKSVLQLVTESKFHPTKMYVVVCETLTENAQKMHKIGLSTQLTQFLWTRKSIEEGPKYVHNTTRQRSIAHCQRKLSDVLRFRDCFGRRTVRSGNVLSIQLTLSPTFFCSDIVQCKTCEKNY